MLLALVPTAYVLATVRPLEGALSLLGIVDILSKVSSAVGPLELASAFHLVLNPVAFVNPTISPSVDTDSMNVVVNELSVIH